MLDSFIAQNEGKVISFDNVPATAGQSVQLVAEWCRFIGLPFQWANAADWWDGSDDTFLEYWEKVAFVEGVDSAPRSGDIVIFSTSLPGSANYGHASLFVRSVSPYHWQGFDANWGGKSAHIVSHNWSYVLGWYTPKNRSVLEGETLTPTPIADEAPGDMYEVETISPTTVKLISTSGLYNLQDASWESFNQNLISTTAAGTVVTLKAKAKHRFGGVFYMPDSNRAEGYIAGDCEEVSKPAKPETIVKKPAVLSKPKVTTIAPPFLRPSTTDTIRVSFDVPRYSAMSDALNGVNKSGTLREGKYFVYKRLNGMLSVTLNLGESMSTWINPDDLEEKPPVDWRTTYKPFRDKFGNITSKYYFAIEDDRVVDYEHGHQLPIHRQQPILIGGWFTGPDGEIYGRPWDAAERFSWFGVRKSNLTSEREIEQPTEPPVLDITPELGKRAKLALVLQNPKKVFDIIKTKT